MENKPGVHVKIEGELIAELLDRNEFHSNVGNVAVVSDQQICLLKRTPHQLAPFELEYLNMNDCSAIDYRQETAYYRIVAGVVCFAAAITVAYLFLTSPEPLAVENGPLIIAAIGLTTFGIRFSTSIHRHILRFSMPRETLSWRSPAIDFKSKSGAALAVRDYARRRGIFQQQEKGAEASN